MSDGIPDNDRPSEETIPPVTTGGAGGIGAADLDPTDEDAAPTAAEEDLAEEHDVDPAEGDAGVLDTDSPEFQHLRKPGSKE